MNYIRPIDDDQAADSVLAGRRVQYLAHPESVTVIASLIQAGASGPPLHFHTSDQFYVMLEGETNLQLGRDVHRLAAGKLAFIPAGLAHRNWNDSADAERHIEFLVPTGGPGEPIIHFVDSVDEAPGTTVAPYVRTIDDAAHNESARFGGFHLQRMADPESGVASCVINAARVDPGRAGPGTHVHEFDQLYFVLEGEMSVEVALQRHTVGRHTLVVLPAGVPHRQFNDGAAPERHLAINVPSPEPGKPWDRGVSFAATGDEF